MAITTHRRAASFPKIHMRATSPIHQRFINISTLELTPCCGETTGLDTTEAIKVGFLITLSKNINCQYWAIASTVGIIGQHIGEHIEGLDTIWHSCESGLTASRFGKDLLVNSATAFAFGAAFDYLAGQLAEFAEGEGAAICGNCSPNSDRFHA